MANIPGYTWLPVQGGVGTSGEADNSLVADASNEMMVIVPKLTCMSSSNVYKWPEVVLG